MTLHWEKLSPAEFQQLQDFASYSTKKLKDVMDELGRGPGLLYKYHPDGDIDYEGFQTFLNTYLEIETPDELCRHLFLSFVKRPTRRPPSSPIPTSNSVPVDGRAIKEMAVMSSTTAVAAIAPHNAGSLSSLVAHSTNQYEHSTSERHFGLAEKLHGLTEKLHSLGHHRSDSDSGSRPRTGSLGACIHPMVNLTLNSSYCNRDDRKSTDSSPSQVSGGASWKNSNEIEIRKNTALVPNDMRNSAASRFQQIDINNVRISIKDIVCYLSLLEGGRPEDKLEFMFRLYDTDGNGVLDTYELDSIVNQMMNVAEYLGWDVSELKPILQDMMVEIDFDADGTVSLEEWKRGGLTTIPLLVLLGLDQTSNFKEDGSHLWRLKNFNRATYCNLCRQILTGLGKKGLCCVVCKYTVHERCVQRAPLNCIQTYCKSRKSENQEMEHHWVEGNCHGNCSRCRKVIKAGMTGKHCRWCKTQVHDTCASSIKPECTLGEYRTFILPPISICPIVLDRQRSFSRDRRSNSGLPRSETSDGLPPPPGETSDTGMNQGPNSSLPTSFQITPLDNTRPLIVFINPKSGGCQGPKLFRRFQNLLNPRQVYNLSQGGPMKALQMFKDVPDVRIICCGGDGTVGWILDSMDKVQFPVQPSVGVIPLGTGNDLARCLRWGGGYEGEALGKILKKMDRASAVMMDRWQIEVSDVDDEDNPGDPMPYNIVNNYFSIGVDAAICVKFHLEREKNPHKFNSRMRNKMWYFEFGMTEQFASSCKNLHQEIEVECDGVSLELSQGPSLQGLALLNIPYTHGGTNMWGGELSRKRAKRQPKRKKKERDKDGSTSSCTDLHTAVQDIGDNLIEVVGLENSLHMGQVRTGLRASGRRLAQCSNIVIKTKKRFPMQIDGEPWMQPPSVIRISHKNQAPMLMAPSSNRRGIFKLFKND